MNCGNVENTPRDYDDTFALIFYLSRPVDGDHKHRFQLEEIRII